MGKIRKDSGVQLLSILKEEAENGAADSMNVWLRLFLQRMLSEEKVSLNTVSFYENLELMEENIDTFEKILDAILSKKPIIFNYKYGLNRVVKMHPYRLKNYNQRWYVIGKRYNDNPCEEFPDEYYEPLAIMSINGIETIKETSFSKPKADIKPWNVDYIPMDEEELDDYFYDVVGLTFTPEGPQDIYIRFSPFRYERYVKTKPISATQREVKPGHEYYDSENPTIKLKVHINKELIQQILSFGSDCEVVAPESLRTRLREELQKMLDKNS